MSNKLPFWKQKSLQQMSEDEWESLCDGCGHCCLHKLEDEDTGIVHYTRVACRLLDIQTCRCKNYPDRKSHVPDCLSLRQENINILQWLPESCAYRLLAEGKDLPYWHPLVCGNRTLIHEVNASVQKFAIKEKPDMDLFDFLLEEME